MIWLLRLIVLAAPCLVFYPALHAGFMLMDDPYYVTSNAEVQKGLSIESAAWAFSTLHFGNYSPVTWLSHMLDWQLFGNNPFAHHAVSLALHASASLLFFEFLRRSTGQLLPSVIAALLFAVHPLRAEPIAWAASRKDVLSGMFCMLTLLLYTKYCRAPSRRNYWMVLCCFVLGLSAKSSLVGLPIVLLALDYWPFKRLAAAADFKLLVWEKLPFFVFSAIFAGLTAYAQNSTLMPDLEFADLTFATRLGNAANYVTLYLLKSYIPVRLAVIYPHPKDGLGYFTPAVAALILFLLSLVAWYFRRAVAANLVGWIWFLVLLLPYLQLSQFGNQSIADRWSYLPHAGLCFAFTWVVMQRRFLPAAAGSCIGVLCVILLSSQSMKQASYWAKPHGILERSVSKYKNNYRGLTALAESYEQANQREKAVETFQTAFVRNPHHAQAYIGMARLLTRPEDASQLVINLERAFKTPADTGYEHLQRGLVLSMLQDRPEGRALYIKMTGRTPLEQALEEFKLAQAGLDNAAQVQHEIGKTLLKLNRAQEAIVPLQNAAQLYPQNVFYLNNLAAAYQLTGQLDKAAELLERSVRISATTAVTRINYGKVLLAQKQLEKAGEQFEAADKMTLQITGKHSPDALNSLGEVYFRTGRFSLAADNLRLLLDMQPANSDAYSNLAAVQLRLGQRDEARRSIEQSLKLNPENAGARQLLQQFN